MQTKDHKALSEYIIKQTGGFKKKIYERAFIFGSVEPDFNVFSYLKGSIKNRMFMGHNYHNSIKYLKKASEKLAEKKQEKWNVMDYYRLGKIIHYVADDFTHPHNEEFSGTLYEHTVYEDELHKIMSEYLEQKEMLAIEIEHKKKLSDAIENLHSKYSDICASHVSDVKWIVEITWMSVCYYLKPVNFKRMQTIKN